MRSLKSTFLAGLLFLILLQLLSGFFQSIYAFGLLVTRFTPEVASIVLIFSPLLLFFGKGRQMRRPLLEGLVLFALICRAAAPLLPLSGQLVASGLGVAALLVFFPGWLAGRRTVQGTSPGAGLTLAVLLSVLLRAAGSGTDWSVAQPLFGLALATLAGGLLFGTELDPQPPAGTAPPGSFTRLAGLAVGTASVFLVSYFAFTSPTVIARWTEAPYPLVVAVPVVALAVFGTLLGSPRFVSGLTRTNLLAANLLFVTALVLAILPQQIAFPADSAAYPLDGPAASAWGFVPLLLMLALSPVIAADLAVFARAIAAERPALPRLGGAFGLAALFFLVMVFLHVFTTIYDYAPLVGPLLRDRFWLVHLLAGLGMALPLLLVPREDIQVPAHTSRLWFPLGLGLLAAGSIVVVGLSAPQPAQPGPSDGLTIMTYNIQQGFDRAGLPNPQAQLAVVRQVDPDILGLQESDTARIANGNVDAVRYFADRLEMYSYYGPTTTSGTFGIALLSKYPIENPRTFFMYSSGEQTAAIQAQIRVEGRSYHVFVTHLGNGGPLVQLQNLLERVEGNEPVIVMGDFNFRPDSEQYALITATLNDAWLQRWPGGMHTPGADMDERIDHFFISPGMTVLEAEFIVSPASDHPALYLVIRP